MHKIRKKCLAASLALLPWVGMAQTNGVWTLQNCIVNTIKTETYA